MNADRNGGEAELLVDFVLGRCDAPAAEQVRRRLAADERFAAEHASLRQIVAVLGRCPAEEPPDDLAERTLARVRAVRQTEALLESQRAVRRRPAPVFSIRDAVALAAMLVLAAGILVPSVRQVRRQTDLALCGANVAQIGAGLDRFAGANDEVLPFSPGDIDNWLPAAGGRCASNSAGLFLLVRRGYAAPGVFQCPAAGGQTFAVAAYMDDFPRGKTIDYSYQYSLGSPIRRQGPLAGVAGQMVVLADATPLFVDGAFRPERLSRTTSDNHRDLGQNVLYLDGHAAGVNDCRVGVNGNNIWLAEGVYRYTGREKPTSLDDTFLLPYPWR